MTILILRDVSIIVLAIESIVIGIVLAILLLEIRELSRLLREEIKPILDSTQETMTTVNTTSQFVGKRVSAPFVAASSLAAGLRQGVKTLRSGVGLPPSGGGQPPVPLVPPVSPAPQAPPPPAPNQPYTEVKNA